ncbi:MAG: PHP domain-containing protein [Clostridia bacterium]
MICDLHLHSVYSDGKLTPEKLVRRAKDRNIDCISLTDHDTISGVSQAINCGEMLGVQVLSGIEISSYEEIEIHILAYNIDYANPCLARELEELQDLRKVRNYCIAEKLATFGINIDMDEIYSQTSNKTIGRPDIADEMVKQGVSPTRNAVFDEYLGFGKKAYVRSKRLTPREAIELATRYGGSPVLAHPKNLKLAQHVVAELVANLKGFGLQGIEADYYAHTDFERKFYRSLADKYKLIVTGGSDYHDSTHGGDGVFTPNKLTRKVLNIKEV